MYCPKSIWLLNSAIRLASSCEAHAALGITNDEALIPSQAQCSIHHGQPVEIVVRLAVNPSVGVNVSSGKEFFHAVILWSGGCVESQKLSWNAVCSRCAVDSRSSGIPWNALFKYRVQHNILSQLKMCWDVAKAPLNQRVDGSSPSRPTTRKPRQ